VIKGVDIKDITSHADDRGFFREIWRFQENAEIRDLRKGEGQISHSLVNKGVIKAWHGHTEQGQLNYVVSGAIRMALIDNRKDSRSFQEFLELKIFSEKPQVYYFPPGVLHGYECIDGPMHIIYMTSGIYDLEDEVRVAPEELESIFKW
jgi:dTDP-4-dehydrorhamnose 3,5-epimerase